MSESLSDFIESEAILFAVREDEEGLAEYLADEDRFLSGELQGLIRAANALSNACGKELRRRRAGEPGSWSNPLRGSDET